MIVYGGFYLVLIGLFVFALCQAAERGDRC